MTTRTTLRGLPAALVSLLCLFPLLFMVTGSLRLAGLAPTGTGELIPSAASLENYARVFAIVPMHRYLLNSLFVVSIGVPLTVLVSSCAAFAMTRVGRRMATRLIAVTLVTLMVPSTALIVSRFAMFRGLGLTDSLWPLVAPAVMGTSPFYVLIFYWSFRRIPPELFDVGEVLGMSPWRMWWGVAMPLVRPVTVAVGVLAFVATWSNFLDPLIYLSDRDLFTVPLGLRSLAALDRTDHPIFLAGSVIATAPLLGAFLFVQRFLRTSFDRPVT